MEDETRVEPLFEFEAPKYVDLRYAASEEGFNDGADEWFDQMKRNSSSTDTNYNFSSHDSESGKRHKTAKGTELSASKRFPKGKFRIDCNMVTARTKQSQLKNDGISHDEPKKLNIASPRTQGDDREQILTETTNQINLLSLKGQNHLKIQPNVSKGMQRNSHKLYSSTRAEKLLVPCENEPKTLGDSISKVHAFKITSNKKNKDIVKNMLAKRVPIGNSNEEVDGELEARNMSRTEVFSSKARDSLPHKKATHRNKKATERQKTGTNKRISNCHTTQPQTPNFLTDERALRFRERVEKLREQSKTVMEPRTPKEYGLAWKPKPTQAKTPCFRSDARLRHCVEKALEEREKQSHANRHKEFPSVVAFGQHTARRAEMYKQKSINSHEEMELRRIEEERRKLRETIMKSRENFQRALDAPNLAANSVKTRKSTVPKEFQFHTLRRPNRAL
ncbi:hypothetical protein Gasu2_69120 [Galdieria sulphuraria]|uniref:Uncharacterized protein n=1 Tax=Galdieria sulphuraria TaxID=130081 RepID=M2XHK5_GALSU|nr:uncharacterized protein Gasu_30060 [Galdieria sulphuraria]EME29567.1 hypothetical protein Gasu_30060 [Galdieria sulphuraria]GJD12843.1 hypothetical protein Gasu2_69120 [Galdieria sulphuraria]|eukprot:XP_005706087.1 hypothetical protein Gasu_30060 [Galdieria sulphuraria]